MLVINRSLLMLCLVGATILTKMNALKRHPRNLSIFLETQRFTKFNWVCDVPDLGLKIHFVTSQEAFVEGNGDNGELPQKRVSRSTTEPKPEAMQPTNKTYLEFEVISGHWSITIGFESIVSLALLQMPAVVLAFYGVFCSLMKPKATVGTKFTDSLLALTLIFMPFCLTELFALLEFSEFAQSWLINKVKSACKPVLDLLCGKCQSTTFDLLKFLPSKDPQER